MKRTLVMSLLASTLLLFSAGCSEDSQEYYDKAATKIQEIYENFDAKKVFEGAGEYMKGIIDKGVTVVGDISEMSEEEMTEKIQTAIFGNEDTEQKPGLGFNVEVNNTECLEDGTAKSDTVIYFLLGTMRFEQKLTLFFDVNEEGEWKINNFSFSND